MLSHLGSLVVFHDFLISSVYKTYITLIEQMKTKIKLFKTTTIIIPKIKNNDRNED